MDETLVRTVTDEAVLAIAFEGMYFLVETRVGVFVDGLPLPPASLVKGFRHTVRLAPGWHDIVVKVGLRRVKYRVELSPASACEMRLSYSRTWGNFDQAYELAPMNWEAAAGREVPRLDAACPEQDINMLRREAWKLRWKTFSSTFVMTGTMFGLITGLVQGSSVYGVVSGSLFGFYMGCVFALIGVSPTGRWYRRQI